MRLHGTDARRRAGAWLALTAVLAAALAACSGEPEERYAAEPVRVADVVEYVSAPGTVQATAQAELRAPAAGRIERLAVEDGARVRAGQVVAQLSSEQVDAAVRQAEQARAAASSLGGAAGGLPGGQALTALLQAQSQLTTSTESLLDLLEQSLPLLPEPERRRASARLATARRELDAARRRGEAALRRAAQQADAQASALRRSLAAAAAAQRAQADLALEAALEQREALTLRSPIAGTVQLGRGGGQGRAALPGLEQLPPGAAGALQGLGGAGGAGQGTGPLLARGAEVAPGQVIATVYDVSTLLVAAEVDETDIALVRAGQPATVQLDAFTGAEFEAEVLRVALAPSQGGLAGGGVTYRVELRLGRLRQEGEGVPATPRLGMTATASIQVRAARDALSVPSSALVGSEGGGQAVLVVEGGKVRARPVQVAASGEDRVAIASGLREGELVVVRGAQRLRDGQDWPGD